MLKGIVQVIQKVDANGNGMLSMMKLPSEIEILGLPSENSYGGDWDLGPTWSYFVMLDKPVWLDASTAASAWEELCWK
jgi:hypothetical protein